MLTRPLQDRAIKVRVPTALFDLLGKDAGDEGTGVSSIVRRLLLREYRPRLPGIASISSGKDKGNSRP